jgi:hypothetical protein|tara:strand:- start:572 stop:1150 length:579 start_codon:yes stop_codon:yes gene_type:complete
MTPTTKLEAINTLLATIGESPVNSLNSGLVEASQAEQTLNNVSRDFQAQGWAFNTEITFDLSPDASDMLTLPANCLHVDTIHTRMSSDTDLVQRGNKMYDRIKNTYAIGTTVSVDMVVLLDFEEMPETARRFVAIKASRILQDRVLGSESLHSYNSQDEMMAWNNMLQSELDVQDLNIFDNYETNKIAHYKR